MLRIAKEALTFDDVLLVPAHSTVLPNTADLRTRLTKNITLNIPMISASMDTVTEARLAIALAQEGGIGFIHKNMSIEQQAEQVRLVKIFEAGVVTNPVTVSQMHLSLMWLR
ncbi:inosine-5'-monophosphate dehydrogenase / CBS domain [Vibrio maritimus]|uniref:Inosine-5'-monophosphate dehydrogenase / CBS domain n=1 Tax=Vibrio maritimus TaxID=990268 RepID=A0A090T838_9VIBR|nr:inosine-5'-monophosphate dehydrogenase / CBS domain [Vibrio maritimus]